MSTQQTKFKEIADAIRDKTGSTELIKPSAFKDEIPKVYDKGYQDGSEVAQKKPYFNTSSPAPHHEYLFFANRWNDYLDYWDLSNIANGAYLFYNSTTLTRVPPLGTSKCTRLNFTFYQCKLLEIIEGIDFSANPNTQECFRFCSALKTIIINGVIPCSIDFKDCVVLDKTTITSIMTKLTDTASGKFITFPKAAINKAFETSSGANDGSTSAEWLALVGAKSNWTISLM